MLGVAWGANQVPPLLPVYRAQDHLTPVPAAGMVGTYGLGLVLFHFVARSFTGRYGPRAAVRLGTLLSLMSTLVMCGGDALLWTLYPGRLLAGVASAFAFGAGSLWIGQFSKRSGERKGARRAAVALSAGSGGGPAVSGAVAQWLPAPAFLPYLVHALLMLLVIPLVWRVPGPTRTVAARRTGRLLPAAARRRRFLLGVVPWAPWASGTTSVGCTVLPAVVADRISTVAPVFGGGVAGLVFLARIAVQPLARRLGAIGRLRLRTAGLSTATAGLAGCALAASTGEVFLVPVVAVVLGSADGLLFVSGSLEVDRPADAGEAMSVRALFHALTYLGTVIPFLLSVFAQGGGYTAPLLVAALVPLAAVPLAATAAGASPRAQPPAPRLTDVPVDPSSCCPARKT
ncbi:MFS transporter [Streptomyces sp. NBC_01462]|uniref:MFS transporter n=1 Tax=Streptomyces sp. NBC_01462 TaxID=2903876 RepID=UPI002E32FC21|nr:MFS transporter [Streptomyces sp. NBC_01462]